jgi:muconolactone D-isomerase
VEYLVHLEIDLDIVPDEERASLLVEERGIALELKRTGVIQRMWRVVGASATYSIWRADSEEQLEEKLGTLPLRRWMDVTITGLSPHYLEA